MGSTADKCIDNRKTAEAVLQALQEIVSWRPFGRDRTDIL